MMERQWLCGFFSIQSCTCCFESCFCTACFDKEEYDQEVAKDKKHEKAQVQQDSRARGAVLHSRKRTKDGEQPTRRIEASQSKAMRNERELENAPTTAARTYIRRPYSETKRTSDHRKKDKHTFTAPLAAPLAASHAASFVSASFVKLPCSRTIVSQSPFRDPSSFLPFPYQISQTILYRLLRSRFAGLPQPASLGE